MEENKEKETVKLEEKDVEKTAGGQMGRYCERVITCPNCGQTNIYMLDHANCYNCKAWLY